jgi:hypothetical protein
MSILTISFFLLQRSIHWPDNSNLSIKIQFNGVFFKRFKMDEVNLFYFLGNEYPLPLCEGKKKKNNIRNVCFTWAIIETSNTMGADTSPT